MLAKSDLHRKTIHPGMGQLTWLFPVCICAWQLSHPWTSQINFLLKDFAAISVTMWP